LLHFSPENKGKACKRRSQQIDSSTLAKANDLLLPYFSQAIKITLRSGTKKFPNDF